MLGGSNEPVHALTDNKGWHKGGVGRLGKSPKYAQMGAGPHFFDLAAWEQAIAASVRAVVAP